MVRDERSQGRLLARLEAVSVHTNSRALLRNVSLTIVAGQVVALVGPSGGGKTTLLHVLSGEQDYCGECLFDSGRRLLFPQDARAALNPSLTIARQVNLIPGLTSIEVFCHWLREAGLKHPDSVLLRFPNELSGGECQRIVWAIALSRSPELLLLDEPTSAVEEEREMALLQLATEAVVRKGGAIVVATHSARLVEQHCSHLILMDNGVVAENGCVDALRSQTAHPYVRAMLATRR